MEGQCLISSCRKSLAAHPHSVAGSFFIPNGCFATRPLTFFNDFLNAVKNHRSGEISVDVMETKAEGCACLLFSFQFSFLYAYTLSISRLETYQGKREVTYSLEGCLSPPQNRATQKI